MYLVVYDLLMVRIINRKIEKETIKHYGFQSVLAGIIFFLGLKLLPFLAKEFVLVAAAGSTAFIIFAKPSSRFADPRRVIGSHFICGIIGFLFYSGYPVYYSFEVAVSLTLIMAILIMVSFYLEHPPAAGTALFFVIDAQIMAFVSLLLLVNIMALISYVLHPYLYDLA